MNKQDNINIMTGAINRYAESNYKFTKGGTKIPKKGEAYYETYRSNKRYINKILKELIKLK